jgi:hypothetical protein
MKPGRHAMSPGTPKKPLLQPIEVFIAFTRNSNIAELQATLFAWDRPGYIPVGIQVQAAHFEKQRLVAAEGLAKADYILADLGTKPGDQKGITEHKKGDLKVEVWTQSSSESATDAQN